MTTLATGQTPLAHSPPIAAGGRLFWLSDDGKVLSVSTSDPDPTVPPRLDFTTRADHMSAIAMDDANLYYSDSQGVWAVPLGDLSETATRIDQSLLQPARFVVGGGHVAVVERAAPDQGSLVVYRSDGSDRVELSTPSLAPLAVDERGVYVSDGGLRRFALDGSGSQLLSTMHPTGVTLTADRIYFGVTFYLWSLPR